MSYKASIFIIKIIFIKTKVKVKFMEHRVLAGASSSLADTYTGKKVAES